MLDPIFTERHLKFIRCHSISLSAGVGDLAIEATERSVRELLQRAVPTEVYISSDYTENDYFSFPDKELKHTALLVQYVPKWCDAEHAAYLKIFQKWDCRHKAAILEYFTSMGEPPPHLVSKSFHAYAMPGACLTPAASCLDEEIRGLASTQQKARIIKRKDGTWKQVAGRTTVSVADDEFLLETEVVDQAKAARLPTLPPNNLSVAPIPLSMGGGGAPLVNPDPLGIGVPPPRWGSDDDETEDHFSIMARWRHMPIQSKILVVVFGVSGVAMLAYGLQPIVGGCCTDDYTSSRFDSLEDSGDADSGLEFGTGGYGARSARYSDRHER
mmetsp:Transcript_61165/g.171100  ORF Transcript_61165/g.171100 Transcript_61165/m.171100 type:complete len:328 (+) Transcript_61165:766-1749(+)